MRLKCMPKEVPIKDIMHNCITPKKLPLKLKCMTPNKLLLNPKYRTPNMLPLMPIRLAPKEASNDVKL